MLTATNKTGTTTGSDLAARSGGGHWKLFVRNFVGLQGNPKLSQLARATHSPATFREPTEWLVAEAKRDANNGNRYQQFCQCQRAACVWEIWSHYRGIRQVRDRTRTANPPPITSPNKLQGPEWVTSQR